MKRVTALALALGLCAGTALAADEFFIVHGVGSTPEQRACQIVNKLPTDDGKLALIRGEGANAGTNANGSYVTKETALTAMNKLCPNGVWTQGSAQTK